jgi:hypothetical protein
MFFLADIAFMWELIGFCMSLILLHKAKNEGGLIRAAGIVLLVGSLALALCTAMGVSKKRAFMQKERAEWMMKHEKSE